MAYIYDEKTGEFKVTGGTRAPEPARPSGDNGNNSNNNGCLDGCLGGCGSKLFWYILIGLGLLYLFS